ncbi:MAG: DUF883 domain-containing protein [Betaproteobacteria bacterium]|nr:MAG: DUF883 domain-containing protein [Betaproteobacteria bacterium]
MDTELQIVTREKLVADMRIVLADTEQLLKAAIGQSGEKLAALQPRIEENLRNARARLAEFERAATEQARAAAQATDAYAHEHPWKVAGFTALLGVAVGLLIGRR